MVKERIEVYLEYLDKESNIMGILSSFCVLAAGIVVERVLSADAGYLKRIADQSNVFVLVGAGLMLYAGVRYYRQRSQIAWYYGQISRAVVEQRNNVALKLVAETDTRGAWRYNNGAHTIIATAFLEFILSVLTVETQNNFLLQQKDVLALGLIAIPIVTLLWINFDAKVLEPKYADSDFPVREYIVSLFKRKKT